MEDNYGGQFMDGKLWRTIMEDKIRKLNYGRQIMEVKLRKTKWWQIMEANYGGLFMEGKLFADKMMATFYGLKWKYGNVRKAGIPLKCGKRRFLVQIWEVWSVVCLSHDLHSPTVTRQMPTCSRLAALLYCALPPARTGQPITARHYDAVSIISTTLFPVRAARRYN